MSVIIPALPTSTIRNCWSYLPWNNKFWHHQLDHRKSGHFKATINCNSSLTVYNTTILTICYTKEYIGIAPVVSQISWLLCFIQSKMTSFALLSTIDNVSLFWFRKQLHFMVMFILWRRNGLHGDFSCWHVFVHHWTLPIATLHVITVVLNEPIVGN